MSARWQRAQGVLWRRSLAGYVVLGPHDPVVLNATGAALWEELAEPSTLPQLAGVLASRFNVEHDRVERDVGGLLEDLHHRGLVVSR